MNSRIEKNYIYNLIYQFVVLLLPIVTTPYLSRTLGAEAIGTYTYIFSIATVLNLFCSLGISMYAQREIAYVQENKEKRSKVFFEIYILRTVILTISIVLFCIIFGGNIKYNAYYKILLLNMVITIFDTSAFFYGIEKTNIIVKANLSIRIFIIICIFLFVKQPNDLIIFLVINLLANFFCNFILLLILHKHICKVSIKSLKLLRHLKPTIILFIPQVANQIYTVIDKIMLGAMISDKTELGFFEQSEKTIRILLNIITALEIVMAPRIANKYSKGEHKSIKEDIINSLNLVYFLSMPMIFGIIAIAKDFVILFLGHEFYKSIYIIYMLSPMFFIIGIASVIGMQYLLPTKKQLQYNISIIFGSMINLIFNFIFIPKFFSIGAAIGTIFTELTVTTMQIYFIRKDFDIKEILKMNLKYFITALFMFVIIIGINKFILLNFSHILRMIIDIVLGIVIYLTILIILKDSFTKGLIIRVVQLKNSITNKKIQGEEL